VTRSHWTTADELLCFSGIAPVIERSGKQCWVRWRYFCPKFFRQSFHEYAGESIQHSFWARAYYASQRAKGKAHHAAARALAFNPDHLEVLENANGLTIRLSTWRVCARKDPRCSNSQLTILFEN
jgi:hypothetical protein